MDIDLPEAAAAQPQTTLEAELASVFEALLKDDASAQEAVYNAYCACLARVEALRAEASNQLHRPARHMALKVLAEEMEAHAATWKLLFCLYCHPDPPAGYGGSVVRGVGGTELYWQRLADYVGKDKELARCARVLAWLESLTDDVQKRQGTMAFAPGEGLWHETKTEMRTRGDAMVSELDPDAPGRTGRALHPSNSRSQERILSRVWQFMRAGNLVAAEDLCRQVGQPWRAAALGGGGLYGTLPVGTTVLEYEIEAGIDLQVEELADEVANGSGTLLALWRWAALQAAGAPPGDKFERAVFGALGGSTAAAAPACASWEDFAWVYCRSWLESQAIRAIPPQPQSAADLVAGDAVAAALVRCGVAPAVAQRSVEGAMSVVMGTSGGGGAAAAAAATAAGPPDGEDEAEPVAGPSGFGQLFAQQVMSPAALANTGPVAVQALRQVQGLIVQGDMYALACHLFATLVDRRSGGAADEFTDADDGATAAFGGGGGASASAVTNPERRRRTCVLAAHLLLALEGLGVLPRKPALSPDALEAHSTLDLAQRQLAFYAGTLLEQEQLSLVPPYLCVLRCGLRSSLCGELLELHTRRLTGVDAVAPDGAEADADHLQTALAKAEQECHDAVVALDYWFAHCVERQNKPLEERSSYLETDIRNDELRIQLATFTFSCRHKREYGPHQRARVARWLALPHIIAAQAAMEAGVGEGSGEDTDGGGVGGEDGHADDVAPAAAAVATAAERLDPWSYYDVLDFANCLCCEFALGDNVTAAAGHRLFEEVLPPSLEMAATAAADNLSAAAAAGAAGGDSPAYLFDQHPSVPDCSDPRGIEAAQRLAAQLRDRAAELAGWRLYFHLDAKLAAWSARLEAHEEARGAPRSGRQWGPEAEEEEEEEDWAVNALLQEGVELLQEFLEHLLRAGWQEELSGCDRALAAAAAADGRIRISLTVTCPPASAMASGTEISASAWGQPTAPYPELQGAAVVELRQAVDSGLRRAAVERGVAAAVVAVEAEPQGHGHVIVNLDVATDDKLWAGVVDLACGMVRGELEGLPPLLLVRLEADRATSLAVCRRCCIGQAVMRCAGLRLSLVKLGADAGFPAAGPQLVEMLAAPAETLGTDMDSGLLELLSPAQLTSVLMIEADTYEQDLRNLQEYKRQLLR